MKLDEIWGIIEKPSLDGDAFWQFSANWLDKDDGKCYVGIKSPLEGRRLALGVEVSGDSDAAKRITLEKTVSRISSQWINRPPINQQPA